jgi:hypothetical protein
VGAGGHAASRRSVSAGELAMGLKAIHNAMRMKDRIARLESRAAAQSRPKKRAVPEWLQTSFEQEGYIFNIAGQIIGCPINALDLGGRYRQSQYLTTGVKRKP